MNAWWIFFRHREASRENLEKVKKIRSPNQKLENSNSLADVIRTYFPQARLPSCVFRRIVYLTKLIYPRCAFRLLISVLIFRVSVLPGSCSSVMLRFRFTCVVQFRYAASPFYCINNNLQRRVLLYTGQSHMKRLQHQIF